MAAYLVRRLLLIIPTLFGIMLINFLIVQAAPGGPIEQLIAQLTQPGAQVTDLMELVRRMGGERSSRPTPVAAEAGDRYAIEREIGRGSVATVYLARDRKHDRAVALKVLKPEIAAGSDRRRFEREIGLLARMHHPHVLPLYDSGVLPLAGNRDSTRASVHSRPFQISTV